MTDKEYEQIIRDAITTTLESYMEWFENETDVVHKDTGKVIKNCEITVKPNAKRVIDYVWPALEKKGIKFSKLDN